MFPLLFFHLTDGSQFTPESFFLRCLLWHFHINCPSLLFLHHVYKDLLACAFPIVLLITFNIHNIYQVVEFHFAMILACLFICMHLHCYSDGMVICHLPHGPTAYYTLFNTVMRHDIPNVGTMSEQYPHLIFHNFTSDRGQRVRYPLCAYLSFVRV